MTNDRSLKISHHKRLPIYFKGCRNQKENYPITYQQSSMSGEQCQGLCHQSTQGTFYSSGTNIGSSKSYQSQMQKHSHGSETFSVCLGRESA